MAERDVYDALTGPRPYKPTWPVADALVEALGCGFALACPAFPVNGRSVYMGHLFVGDRLLSWARTFNAQLTPLWPLLMGALLILPLWQRSKDHNATPSVLWTLYWLALLLWTLFGQNPDNPRHLAPITLLGIVLLAGWLPRRGEWVVAVAGLLLLGVTFTLPRPPAMVQAAKASGKLLLEAFHYRFHPLFVEVMRLV